MPSRSIRVPTVRTASAFLSLVLLSASCSRSGSDEAAARSDHAPAALARADHLLVIERPEDLGTIPPSPDLIRSLGVYAGSKRTGLRRQYGPQASAHCVTISLNWLARHQVPEEGFWDAARFIEYCCGNICGDKGCVEANTAVTALSVLHFLGMGYTHQAGMYKTHVGNALKWFRRNQDQAGCLGLRTGPYLYGHTLATLALSEAYALSNSPLLRRPLERAVSFLLQAQNRDPDNPHDLRAWGGRPQCGRDHLAVTTWAVMALRSARDAGLEVPDQALAGAHAWIQSLTDPATGTVRAEAEPGEGGLPASSAFTRTAMAVTARVARGEDPHTSPVIQKAGTWLVARIPGLYDERSYTSVAAWYFGTVALFQIGGPPWKNWNRAFKKQILSRTTRSGCERQSWKPHGPWAAFGGRIHATALMSMACSIYYRYGKAVGTHYLGGTFTPQETEASPESPGVGCLLARGPGLAADARFPLERTDVNAEVAGSLATTRVAQTFGNPYTRPVEAVYVFPLPTRAAVNDFVLEVHGRRIVGVVRPRAEARRLYQAARARGQTASLLTQERPNVFTQNVANIAPHGRVKVTITFFESLDFEKGDYTYVFPLTVGPRYIPGKPSSKGAAHAAVTAAKALEASDPKAAEPTTEPGGGVSPDTDQVPDASRVSPPVAREGRRPDHRVSIRVSVDAGVPIEAIRCPTHDVNVTRPAPARAEVTLAPHDHKADRDFVLRWRVAGDTLRTGCVAQGDSTGRGTFTAYVIPVLDSSDADVSPREITFVLDTSGSMEGLPLELSCRLVEQALRRLRTGDRFNIIEFAGSSGSFAPEPVPVSEGAVKRGLAYLNHLSGGGGTEMLAGMRRYLAQPREARYVRYVCFLTDGFVGNENEILKVIKQDGQDARWYSFGIGSSVNRFLIEGIARHGRGASTVVLDRERGAAERAADRFLAQLDAPLLTEVTLDPNGLPITDVYPEKLPDLMPGRPVQVIGRYTRPAAGTIHFRGRLRDRTVTLPCRVSLPEGADGYRGLTAIWARSRIAWLEGRRLGASPDEQRQIKKQIEATAIRHRLASRYTAFVAVDEACVVGDGQPLCIVQPVELPRSVSREGATGEIPAGRGVRVEAWGVTFREKPDARLIVASVDPDSEAGRAGVQPGDELFALGRYALFGARHLESLLWQATGNRIVLGFRAGGRKDAPPQAVPLPRPRGSEKR